MNNILEIRNLSKSYRDFSLENVSFSLPCGYIMGLIGPNGSGKTTIIKLILNLLKKQSGDIEVFGAHHIKCEEAVKQDIGVVFDEICYAEDWNMRDVERALRIFYKRWDSGIYTNYLKKFGILPARKVKELSRGQKTKLMLAAALSHDARFLILDEPSMGLDAVGRDEIMEIIRDFISSEERSVLFSTHQTLDLEKTADYITFINNGRLFYTGTKDDLMESYCIVKGDRNDVSPGQKGLITGYREYNTGFEGLMPARDIRGLSSAVLTEPASLDDIIVFMNRGGNAVG